MKVPVIWPKIIIPKRRANLLTRQRLIDRLHDLLDYKLLVITAPAGYGKTSLLVDFASQTELPICWYTLDEHDQDIQRFLAHLIASITRRFPEFGKTSASILEEFRGDTVDLSRLVGVIVNDTFNNISEPFAVVLDDFHLVEDSSQISDFLNQLIQRVDENFHLVIATRRLLALPGLSLMVAQQLAGGLGYELLAFQAAEVQDLLLRNYGLTVSDALAQGLCQETEGWVTGLLLSAETIGQGMVERIQMVRSLGVNLYDYLTEQVYDQLPPPIQHLLLQTSLFDEFDVRLCQQVLGPTLYPEKKNWSRLIEALVSGNLFVQMIEGKEISLRYHHLFRDFLQKKLAQEYPDEEALILRQLASVYVERQEWDKAFAAYQRLGDPAAVADFIEQTGLSLVKNGRHLVLIRWLECLPEAILAARPVLQALYGCASVSLGRIEKGLAPLNQAIEAFQCQNDLENLARTLTWRAVAQRFLGDYPAALSDADVILGLFRDGAGQVYQAEALRLKGLVLQQLGRLDEALNCLERSLQIYQDEGKADNAAVVSMGVGLLLCGQGKYRSAEGAYQQALAQWRKTNNVTMQANLLNNLGVLLHCQGDYEKAITHLEEALDCAEQSGDVRVEALALSSIGDIYLDLGDVCAAQNAYSKAAGIAQKLGYSFLLLYIELAQSAASRMDGNLVEAHACLKRAEVHIRANHSNYECGLYQYELGQILCSEGAFQEAAPHLAQAANQLGQSQQLIETIRAQIALASAYHALGETDKALLALKQALQASSGMERLSPLIAVSLSSEHLLGQLQGDPEVGAQATRLLGLIGQNASRITTLLRRLRDETLTLSFTGPKLVVRALGQMQVWLCQKLLTEWEAQTARDLLFCLLAHPNGLTKDEIGALLWPDCSPGQLKVRFKKNIYRLRRAAGEDSIIFEQERYAFNWRLDYDYDVETFRRKLDQAQSESAPDQRARLWREAVELYGGPYLPDLDGTWVWPERERLWQAYVAATLALASYYLENGQPQLALEHCNKIIHTDPLIEDAHRYAMRVHAATGNRAGVIRQYELCQQTLAEELGAAPSSQTNLLYKTLIK